MLPWNKFWASPHDPFPTVGPISVSNPGYTSSNSVHSQVFASSPQEQPACAWPISLVVIALALRHIFRLFLSLSDLQLLFLRESQPQPSAILSLGDRGVATVPGHPTAWNSQENRKHFSLT